MFSQHFSGAQTLWYQAHKLAFYSIFPGHLSAPSNSSLSFPSSLYIITNRPLFTPYPPSTNQTLGLATIPVYGYDHIDYGCLLYKKIGPAGTGMGSCCIHTVQVPYVCIQAHYSVTTSAVMALTCIKVPVLKFQISKFMNHKLSRNQIRAGFCLPIHNVTGSLADLGAWDSI